ncbi:hypothetical protein NMY22_g7905 [Coprinellus aureogranulatus]|nr:hypothetical protein NMY22_g7905 [Coprinellus aureogranulatus]
MLDLLQYPKTVTVFLLFLQFAFRYLRAKKVRSNLPLPPRPKGFIGIGNLLDIPAKNHELAYSKLADRYGDMVYLETFGTRILVLSSLARTTDLFERRSSVYSDRSDLPMLCGEMAYDAYFSLMRYGTRWRRQRRLFHEHFNPTAVKQFHPLILDERVRYVEELYRNPKEFLHVIRDFISRILLKTSYGIEPTGKDDPFISRLVEVTVGFTAAATPGAFLVDFIPALKYVPDWLPGTSWKRFARSMKKVAEEARVIPFEQIQEMHKMGTAPPSALRAWIDRLPPSDDPTYEEERLCAQDTAGMSYIAGTDTSVGAALAVFLLLAMHPQVQKRAQKEIDEVVGFGRLPDFDDRPQLVYTTALIKEVFRLHPVLPTALPHTSAEDDVYDGYFIPKGTVVIGNAWHILHDPSIYPEPFKFRPERFIKDGHINKQVVDPYSAAFGFGRRICPGRHVSTDSLYALISSTLALFDIIPPRDENGNCLLKEEFDGGVLSHPKPFECLIAPRSDRHEELVRNIGTLKA